MEQDKAPSTNDGLVRAEFHDIGKIVDWQAVGLYSPGEEGGEPHDFEKCVEEWDVRFAAPTWESVFRKDQRLRHNWPKSAGWIAAFFADHLAASLSRLMDEGQKRNFRSAAQKAGIQTAPEYGRHNLWKDEKNAPDRLTTEEELRELIQFLNGGPSWEDTYRDYGRWIDARAEEAFPGLNVTTLRQHSKIVGKLARVIQRLPWTDEEVAQGWQEIKATRRQITVARYRLVFPQKPYRTRDLEVFAQIERATADAALRFPDNVLLRVDDQIIATFESEKAQQEFESFIVQLGFHLRKRSRTEALSTLARTGLTSKLGHETIVYPDLPEEIALPICENCQFAQGAHSWSPAELSDEDDEPIADERLCDRCFNLRKTATRLTKLTTWRDGRVAWLFHDLDLDECLSALTDLIRQRLRARYGDELVQNFLSGIEATYPLLSDFVDDYSQYLGCLKKALVDEFDSDRIESIGSWIACVRLESQLEASSLIRVIHSAALEAFPTLLDQESTLPFRVGVSISNPKYPFFAHWRAFQDMRGEVNVSMIGTGQCGFRLKSWPKIEQAMKATKRAAVHRFASATAVSPALGDLILRSKETGRFELSHLRSLIPDHLSLEGARVLSHFLTEGEDG